MAVSYDFLNIDTRILERLQDREFLISIYFRLHTDVVIECRTLNECLIHDMNTFIKENRNVPIRPNEFGYLRSKNIANISKT